jgi:hypothetical protein
MPAHVDYPDIIQNAETNCSRSLDHSSSFAATVIICFLALVSASLSIVYQRKLDIWHRPSQELVDPNPRLGDISEACPPARPCAVTGNIYRPCYEHYIAPHPSCGP